MERFALLWWCSARLHVEPQASKPPHCYVAMPILPSNAKANLGESLRISPAPACRAESRKDAQTFAKIRRVSPDHAGPAVRNDLHTRSDTERVRRAARRVRE
jgi:hypothetical protein